MSAQPGSLAVGFAGTPSFALPALEALARSPHRVRTVLTQPDRPAGRGRTLAPSAVKVRALELGLPLSQPQTLQAPPTRAELESLGLDVLVVVAYGLLLPPALLAVPRLGCLNIHASILPRWRGAAPVQRAILAGDRITGVSIMQMDPGLDTGPVLAQRRTEIGPLETAGELAQRLAAIGAELLLETLEALAAGQVEAVAQPSHGASYAPKIEKRESLIDWSADAPSIARQVRAFNPTPVAETRLAGTQLRIWEAESATETGSTGALPGTVRSASPHGIEVVCGEGVLRIKRLQLAGRKPLAAREFSNAHPLVNARLGA